ncbi:MAG: efflux RND transporter periplasmic adaptor subunit [Planctomycetes bacterium]|nr:efflux RND transporter periplasmic adaptor subunit [Planctomycetota bacterium]
MSLREAPQAKIQTARRTHPRPVAVPKTTSLPAPPASARAKAPPTPPHRGRKPVLLASLALMTSLGAYALTRPSEQPLATLPAAPAPASFVAAPGVVESAAGLRELAFPLGGRIAKVHVSEHERVREGQLVAELDSADGRARLAEARANLAIAEAEESSLRLGLSSEIEVTAQNLARRRAERDLLQAGTRPEDLDRARAHLRAAEAEWRRQKADHERYLQSPEAVTRQQIEMSAGLAQIREAEYQAAQAALKALEQGPRAEERAQAEALARGAGAEFEKLLATREPRLIAAREAIARAKARVAAAEADLDKTRLRSPVDGIVVWRYRHTGETVGLLPPEPVLAIADDGTLRVRAEIHEADFPRVQPGRRVRVRADAYGEQDFEGRIESVGIAAGKKRIRTGEPRELMDLKVVEALIVFDTPPPFKLSLRVTTYIETDPDPHTAP